MTPKEFFDKVSRMRKALAGALSEQTAGRVAS